MIKKLLIFVAIFILGALCTSIYADLASSDPVITNPFSTSAREIPSPGDRINQDNIHVYNDRVIIDINNPKWARFTNTNSMDPIIDEEAHAIEIMPKEDSLKIGDIVAYKPKGYSGTVIHRIVDIKEDQEGTYYILQGDNNPRPDGQKVRYSQVKGVVVAILY